jgi:hypothetical protein
MNDREFERQFADATRRGEQRLHNEPRAIAARYDRRSVTELLAGVLGTKAWMAELGRAGGRVKSAAKSRAARRNGAKGGRPRKRKVADPSVRRRAVIPAGPASHKSKSL